MFNGSPCDDKLRCSLEHGIPTTTMIHITITDRNMRRPAIWKSCIAATLILLGCSAAQACSLSRAEYKNVAEARARLRIGAVNGEYIYFFKTPTQSEQVPLSGVIERVQIMRFNAKGRVVPHNPLAAPATFVLSGFNDVAGVGDEKWKLFRRRK